MGKPNKSQDKWMAGRIAQEKPDVMARVDGRMYVATVDSVNLNDNTAMIRYSPQPGVKITYQTRLSSVIGALNHQQALYHVSKE